MDLLRRINLALGALLIVMLVVIANRFRSDEPSAGDVSSPKANTAAINDRRVSEFSAGSLARQTRQDTGPDETSEASPGQIQPANTTNRSFRNTAQDSPLDRAAVGFDSYTNDADEMIEDEFMELGSYDGLSQQRVSRLIS